MWAWGLYGAIGFQLAMSVVLGLLAGDYVDRHLGWSPWGTLVGLLLGSLVGFTQLFKLILYKEKLEEKSKEAP